MDRTKDSQSYWAIVWQQFRKRRLAWIGLTIAVVFVLTAMFAPLIANNKPIVARWNGKLYFPAFTTYVNPEAYPLPNVTRPFLCGDSDSFMAVDPQER